MKPTLRPVLAILPVLACLLITSQLHAKAEKTFSGPIVAVSDGDTFTVKHCYGDHCQLEKIRLHWADAPEIAHNKKEQDQPGGREALDYLSTLKGKVIQVSPVGLSYGRTVADCKLGETDLALSLVSQGLAMCDPRYKPSNELKAAQTKAAEQGLGIWKEPNPTPPWEHRAKLKSDKFPLNIIKGNK